MYVQGVSTRKIKTITEELCGHEFSASASSEMNVKLDGELERFARRALEVEFASLILDARYEKVREEGVIRSRAVLVAIGIDKGRPPPDPRREDRQSRKHHELPRVAPELKTARPERHAPRHLPAPSGAALRAKAPPFGCLAPLGCDDHAGLKRALAEVLPEACWQRCYVHFLRNALDHLPRKTGDDCRSDDLRSALRATRMRCRATQCLTELRWLYDRRDAAEARQHLAAWIEHWQAKHPKLTTWVEAQIEETFTFYRFPQTHHKHLKSTNFLERFHQELKRRSLVVRMLPAPSGLPVAGFLAPLESPTTPVACASSARWPPSSTRNGSTVPATSTCSHSPIAPKLNSNSPPNTQKLHPSQPAFADLDAHNPFIALHSGGTSLDTLVAGTLGDNLPGGSAGFGTGRPIGGATTPVRVTFTNRSVGIVNVGRGVLDLLARTSEPAPDVHGVWQSLGLPAAGGSAIAFRASLRAVPGSKDVTNTNCQVLYARKGEHPLALLARQSDAAPGFAALTSAVFSDPVLNAAGDILYFARLAGCGVNAANREVLYVALHDGGSTAVVQRTGEEAPELPGVNLGAFTGAALPQNADANDSRGPVFTARLMSGSVAVKETNHDGLFAADSTGALRLQARTGQPIDGKTLRTIGAFTYMLGSPVQARAAAVSPRVSRRARSDSARVRGSSARCRGRRLRCSAGLFLCAPKKITCR